MKAEYRERHIEYLKKHYDMPEDVFNAHMKEYDAWIYACEHFDRKSAEILHPGCIIESPEVCGCPSVPYKYVKKEIDVNEQH